jgi:hypothetical protein
LPERASVHRSGAAFRRRRQMTSVGESFDSRIKVIVVSSPLACRVTSCLTSGDGSRFSTRTEASAPAAARSADVMCQSYLSSTSLSHLFIRIKGAPETHDQLGERDYQVASLSQTRTTVPCVSAWGESPAMKAFCTTATAALGCPASEHDPARRNDGFTVDALNILYIFYFNLMFLIVSLINMSSFVPLKLRESPPHEHETIRPPQCSPANRPDRNGRCHRHRHPTAAKAAVARAGQRTSQLGQPETQTRYSSGVAGSDAVEAP